MTKKDITSNVLKKIQKDKIQPKPKWEFLLKNYVFWGAFAFAVVLGAFATSGIIFQIATSEWDIPKRLGENMLLFSIKSLPYYWIVLLAGFIALAYYNFKHTKSGFKYRFPIIALSSIIISAILGSALFGLGVAKRLDEQAMKHLPLYKEQHLQMKKDMWSRIDEGLIAGEIIKIHHNKPTEILLENLKGETWQIKTDRVPRPVLDRLKEGMVVGIEGEVETQTPNKKIFDAEKIRPWKGNFLKETRRPLRTI
jgi:hypothetical protein